MIDSVRGARREAERSRSLRVVWSWVDDGSTDGTAEWLASHLRVADAEVLVANESNSYAAAARNQAVARFASDVVNIFDSDDEMYPHHLVAGHDTLFPPSEHGKLYGAMTTLTDFGDGDALHPEWVRRISIVNVNTTFYRREVWDFLEGMPDRGIYRHLGGEDQDIIGLLNPFFPLGIATIATARYWRYPGNAFDQQLEKFRSDPAFWIEPMAPIERRHLNDVREAYFQARLRYLKLKLSRMVPVGAFNHLRTGPAFVELGLTY